MLIKANSTHLRAEVLGSRPSGDGTGAEIDVRVLENRSPGEQDFLKPGENSNLTLYSRKPIPAMESGQIVEIEAELRAGPFGQRIICRDLKKVADR